jgi:hypothetical protein
MSPTVVLCMVDIDASRAFYGDRWARRSWPEIDPGATRTVGFSAQPHHEPLLIEVGADAARLPTGGRLGRVPLRCQRRRQRPSDGGMPAQSHPSPHLAGMALPPVPPVPPRRPDRTRRPPLCCSAPTTGGERQPNTSSTSARTQGSSIRPVSTGGQASCITMHDLDHPCGQAAFVQPAQLETADENPQTTSAATPPHSRTPNC